jgi:Phosphorylase superfamily
MLAVGDIVLVPKGAEYRAVCRGIGTRKDLPASIVPMPIGSRGLRQFLAHWQQSPEFLNKPGGKIVLLGLAGSLSDRYGIGDAVIYQGCAGENGSYLSCGAEITAEIAQSTGYPTVRGWTSDRVIGSAQEKAAIAQRTGCEVVDMEGAIVLEVLAGCNVAIVRVISDGVGQNLPDLERAIDDRGDLQPLSLAVALCSRPSAAFSLIRGSLRGLQTLQEVAAIL